MAKHASKRSRFDRFRGYFYVEMEGSVMEFDQQWELFVQKEMRSAKGVRLERLKKNLIGEKKLFREALWPVFRTFEGFSLEYPIKSISGVTIYIDIFYHPFYFAFENEGFVPHAENITRARFSFERMRIRTMAQYGYKFIPFSWDELDKRPENCRRSVYELLGRYSHHQSMMELTVFERELIRYVIGLNRAFRLRDAGHCLGLKKDACRKVLRSMLEKNLLESVGEGKLRIKLYALTEQAKAYLLS